MRFNNTDTDLIVNFFSLNNGIFESFKRLISIYYPLSSKMISKYRNEWLWSPDKEWYRAPKKSIASNENIKWTSSLIGQYENHLNFENLSDNQSIPWSTEIIDSFLDKWNWNNRYVFAKWQSVLLINGLVFNRSISTDIIFQNKYIERINWQLVSQSNEINWSYDLIEKYKDLLDWIHLSKNSSLPWSLDLFLKFEEKWKYDECYYLKEHPSAFELFDVYNLKSTYLKYISSNENIIWNDEVIEINDKYLDWDALSGNKALPWSKELITKYEDKWNWALLSSNEYLNLTEELLEKYENKWDWDNLSSNQSLALNEEIIEKYKSKWIWYEKIYYSGENVDEEENLGILFNPNFPNITKYYDEHIDLLLYNGYLYGHDVDFDFEIIKKYADKVKWSFNFWNRVNWEPNQINYFSDKIDWELLSKNENFKWSVDFLHTNKNRLNWKTLSDNKGSFWNDEIIDSFVDLWDWNLLSKNYGINWTIPLISKYSNRLSWSELSHNFNLPWSKSLILNFKEFWSWNSIIVKEEIEWDDELFKILLQSNNRINFDSENNNSPFIKYILTIFTDEIIERIIERGNQIKPANIEAYFENINAVILKELKLAKFTIKIAVTWFTDISLFNTVRELSKKIQVELILLDDEINKSSGINYKALYKNCSEVLFYDSDYNNSLMHNKFCIIDEKTVITGSYNWTNNAILNEENIVVVNSEKISRNFVDTFNRIKNTIINE